MTNAEREELADALLHIGELIDSGDSSRTGLLETLDGVRDAVAELYPCDDFESDLLERLTDGEEENEELEEAENVG